MSYTSAIVSTTFTPAEDCDIEVTASWMGAGNGSGLGQQRISHIFVIQDGTTTRSTGVGIPKGGYAPYVERAVFAVTAAGGVVTAGIAGQYTGAITINWKDVEITVRKV